MRQGTVIIELKVIRPIVKVFLEGGDGVRLQVDLFVTAVAQLPQQGQRIVLQAAPLKAVEDRL